MEENPQAPEEQEVGEDPQEKASDARKEAFIEEFIRAHEELLLAENSFFKRLAPAGFLLDAVLFFYATLVVFNTIHTLASRPQIPIGSLLMSVAISPLMFLVPFAILAYLLFFIPQRLFFGAGSLLMTLKAVLYAASKLFVLVLPMDLGLALLGANKDPFLLAMLPLSPAGSIMQISQLAYFALVLVAFLGSLRNILLEVHGLPRKKASLALVVCFGVILGVLVGLKALQQG